MTAPLKLKVAAAVLAATVTGTPERYNLPPIPNPPTEAELAHKRNQLKMARAARNEHWEKLEADLERLIDALGEDFNLFGAVVDSDSADPEVQAFFFCLSKTYFVRLGTSGRWYITCDGCLAVPVDRGYGGRIGQRLADDLDALPPGITESRWSDLFPMSDEAVCAAIRRDRDRFMKP